jgi:dTDP-4-amino-4,6-dideoxygalactose transaminase
VTPEGTPPMTEQIPSVDLAFKHERFLARYVDVLKRVVGSGQFILGDEVKRFERAVAARIGARDAIGVANGTDALILALKRIGVGPGDEVVTTPMSYLATTSAIALCGATPVFVDVDDSLNMDPSAVSPAITKNTKAVVLAHLAGIPADMPRIVDVAASHGLAVVEDCAQSFGAEYAGRHTGTFGRFGAVSFHPLKNLGALGDAGMIYATRPDDAEWLRIARNHGHSSRDECEFWSVNSRLDELQAGFLCEQLAEYDAEVARRRALAAYYRTNLSDVVEFPLVAPQARPSYNWIMALTDRRDELLAHLSAASIDVKIHYPKLIPELRAACALERADARYPNARRQVARIFSLPSAEHVSLEVAARVCATIREFFVR